MKNEKILKWLIYLSGILCLYAFVSVRSLPLFNAILKEKMIPGYWDKTKYGELYYFSMINKFKEKGLPPAQKKYQYKSKNASLNDADIFVFGDSFFDFSRHTQFAERLSDTLNAKVHYYYGDYPLMVLAENHYQSTRPKVLLYERVERYIPMVFENKNTADYEVDDRSAFRKRIGNVKDKIFYKRSEELFDALLKRSYLTTGIYSCIATVKFDVFRYISPLTPVYSADKEKPWLFYSDQTNGEKTSFYYHHSEADMNNYCDHMADLAAQLKEEYNIRLIYLPLPAKYTLYHNFVNHDKYNDFLPELYKGLRKRGVEFIDVFDDFKNSDDILYYRTDSHWNEKGIEMAFNKTMEYFRKDSTLKKYYNQNKP